MKYLLISTISLSVLYLVYRMIFNNETNFKNLRAYLLISILISLILPFNSYNVYINFDQSSTVQKVETTNVETKSEPIILPEKQTRTDESSVTLIKSINWVNILRILYLAISLILLLRISIQVFKLLIRYFSSDRIKKQTYIFVYNSGYRNTFSFFKWIFVYDENESNENLDKIISHEKIHANQYHSVDIIIIEVLTAFMWFNPFVWMMRQSIQLLHEYLADEGVINTGESKKVYQELLVNQIAEEKLIHIISSFNQSLIKKRIIMMNNEKITKKFGLKFTILIPVTFILLLGISCINGQETGNNSTVAAIAPTKMNVLYLGVENPLNIAVSGYVSSEIVTEVTGEEGIIQGENGNYLITPKKTGLLTVVVKAKGKTVREAKFRVKPIPGPVVYVNGRKGGEITKEELLNTEEILIYVENFDFDIRFEIVGFLLSTVNSEGFTLEASSNSGKITTNQREIIESVQAHSRIIFEDISFKGPDGKIKQASPVVFEIIE